MNISGEFIAGLLTGAVIGFAIGAVAVIGGIRWIRNDSEIFADDDTKPAFIG